MALILKDRVQETATAVTTVSFALAGAVVGYQTFSSSIGNTNTTYYGATDGTNWEVGVGTYITIGNLLNRTTILSSSNSGSAVTFSGSVTVFCDYPSGKSVYLDSSGNASGLGTPVAFVATNVTGLPLTTGVTGTLPVGNGGTGATTLTGLVVGNGTSAMTVVTAPSGAVVGTTDTQTLTNKTITARVSSTTSITSPLADNSDNFDEYVATAQASNFTISADAGTPTDGRKIIYRITSDATPRVVTFTGTVSKGFKPVGVTLTVSGSDFTYTLTASKTTYFGAIYSTASARWEIVAISQEA